MSEPITRTYKVAMRVCGLVVRRWGRLQVEGLEHVPTSGPLLMAVNHDSHWDPVAVGVAALKERQIRALAKAELWKNPVLGKILDGMRQIKLYRGKGPEGGMQDAIRELRAGACIGIFPEGTLSWGHELRARSGLGVLAREVPEATVVNVAVVDTVAVVRFPRRPRITVRFFPPAGGQLQPGEEPSAFVVRLMEEIREEAPRVAAGRDPEAQHAAAAERLAAKAAAA